jgi:hypothetical protein
MQTTMTRPEVISPTAKAKKNPFRIPASPLRSNWKNDLGFGESSSPSFKFVMGGLFSIHENRYFYTNCQSFE